MVKSISEQGHPALILGVAGLAVALPSAKCTWNVFSNFFSPDMLNYEQA